MPPCATAAHVQPMCRLHAQLGSSSSLSPSCLCSHFLHLRPLVFSNVMYMYNEQRHAELQISLLGELVTHKLRASRSRGRQRLGNTCSIFTEMCDANVCTKSQWEKGRK